MGSRRTGGLGLVAALAMLGTVGLSVVLAQPPSGKGKASASARGNAKKGVARKAPPNAADPLAAKAKEKEAPPASYHFRLKIHAFDDATLVADYYPVAKFDTTAPAVLLVHEKDRSGKDFEDPIADLKGVGLAEHLQGAGYAVLVFDLRGYGANARKAMKESDWRAMVDDMQAAYQFLVDRHNRGELNLGKLGVVALGEGANLAAAWAEQPGGGVSSEGRVTDISGLALLSPLTEGEGYTLSRLMNSLAPRVPILLAAGERDAISHEAVKRARGVVEKTRLNKVELFPSSLHGYKLLRLEPRVTTVLNRFLEGTVRLKPSEWEPRYNLNPVSYTDIQVVRHAKVDENAKAKAEEEKEKAKDAGEPKKGDDVPPPPPAPKAEGRAKGAK